jgi:ActR/RegA family two-component response regulator
MYFELIRDAAGQTNQPYERSARDLNMHRRGFGRKFNQSGV